jgi:hypothetical protein
VARLRCAPLVAMVQTADLWNDHDRAERWPGLWRVVPTRKSIWPAIGIFDPVHGRPSQRNSSFQLSIPPDGQKLLIVESHLVGGMSDIYAYEGLGRWQAGRGRWD